jgi:hypothetical protein
MTRRLSSAHETHTAASRLTRQYFQIDALLGEFIGCFPRAIGLFASRQTPGTLLAKWERE